MKKMKQLLFLSCLKATELIEKKIHIKLSFTEKLQLKVHKSMCQACTNYEKQSYLIEKAISHQEDNKSNKIEVDLESFKKTILERLGN